jgi:Spx/MgsR family transcriptional regulator
MAAYILYGIKQCSTVAKARHFLDEHTCDYVFHDFRKEGVDDALLFAFEQRIGWELMLNKRSTTWRQLADTEKKALDCEKALALMLKNPTLIKRPLLDTGKTLLVGFKIDDYTQHAL